VSAIEIAIQFRYYPRAMHLRARIALLTWWVTATTPLNATIQPLAPWVPRDDPEVFAEIQSKFNVPLIFL